MDQVLQSKTLNQENAVSFICFPLKTIPWPRFLYNRAQLHLKFSPHLLKAFTDPIKTGPSFKFVIKSKFKSTSWLQITLCSSNSYLFPPKGKKIFSFMLISSYCTEKPGIIPLTHQGCFRFAPG